MNKFVGIHHRYPDFTGKRVAEGGRRLRGETRKSREDAPLVTIITVCWNSANTIEQTFQSVCDQTYDNIEYVVVDAASTDGTVDILRAHEDLIDYYVSEPDEGLYYAMNKGIELAQGDYILILNSDDWYVDDAVEALVAAREYSGCDFVSGLKRNVNSYEKVVNLSPVMHLDYSVYLRAPIHHETMLVPSWLYNQIGPYKTDYRIIGDLDFMIRLFEAGITHFKLLKQISFFRQTGVSNADPESMVADRIALLRDKFPFLDKSEINLLADRKSWTGFDLLELASRHSNRTDLVNAIRDYMLDHTDRALQGRGLHVNWKPYAKVLVEKICALQANRSPRVSVILPVYNAEKTLRRSIESVLSQGLQDIELICVNDQTPDGSQAIIDEYARLDARVVPLMNKKNIGLGASRNVGIRAVKGQYVFHLDPDDTLPPDALKEIHDLAERYGSDMTRGAYLHEQYLLGQTEGRKQRKGLKEGAAHIVNTTLKDSPNLLDHTEGHWSFLYKADFAKRVKYPEDLKMGQDSMFLVKAMTQARSISITDALVYHYRANPNSAMNTFNFRKFMDSLEWRIRAWRLLRDACLTAVGEHLLFGYWNTAFFQSLRKRLSNKEKKAFDQKLGLALKNAGYFGSAPAQHAEVREYFENTLRNFPSDGASIVPNALRIATLSTQDYGGAGIGSTLRVEALNRQGAQAELHVLLKKSTQPFVKAIRPKSKGLGTKKLKRRQAAWRKAAVLTQEEHPGLKARELFSKTGSVVDFRETRAIFDGADIIHLHWVAGIFDYENADVLSEKPVVWTLADMNAFTGGCHYSEGCTNYKNDCRNCPLLAEGSRLAHSAWRTKRKSYAKLRNLHIICPSQWLAERARESSLLGDRPIHVIPNAIPVDRFTPTDRLEARKRLGLPLDRKFIAFGAENVANKRKGGDILAESVGRLRQKGLLEGVEGLFFGRGNLALEIKSHNMGHVLDEAHLSLIYAAADVFAFPSREDNAPLTVVESMLSGTPVVAFPVGNVPELVTHLDTGYIAQYEDAQDFAEGLAWALSDTDSPEAVERRNRARRRAWAHNDPKVAAQRHLTLYRQMLDKEVRKSESVTDKPPRLSESWLHGISRKIEFQPEIYLLYKAVIHAPRDLSRSVRRTRGYDQLVRLPRRKMRKMLPTFRTKGEVKSSTLSVYKAVIHAPRDASRFVRRTSIYDQLVRVPRRKMAIIKRTYFG